MPQMPLPYVLAQIELIEQPGLQLISNLIGVASEGVQIGMAVEACFARAGRAYIPLFRPVGAGD
jgi:uncharacterized OB-fold protein